MWTSSDKLLLLLRQNDIYSVNWYGPSCIPCIVCGVGASQLSEYHPIVLLLMNGAVY